MTLDPILRFNWIFYVIFAWEAQHSSLVSFLIALAEVLRRGMWTMIRIENEHCTNVRLARATIRPPMPYEFDRNGKRLDVVPQGGIIEEDGDEGRVGEDRSEERRANGSEGRTPVQPSPAQQTLKRVGQVMAAAHAFDYERKRPQKEGQSAEEEEDDDDDEEDE